MSQALVVATDLATSRRAIQLAQHFEGWLVAVGVHPHDCAGFDGATLTALRRLAEHPKVAAIGETGLDFQRQHQPREAQERAFVAQCELAAELGLPVVVHSRESLSAIAAVLGRHLGAGGIMHSFTGTPDEAQRFADLGVYVSISGIVTFANAAAVRATAAAVPQDRLLLETDAPYLAPVPLRGRRNEPAHLAHTAAAVAASRGISVPSLATCTTCNARTVLGVIGPRD